MNETRGDSHRHPRKSPEKLPPSGPPTTTRRRFLGASAGTLCAISTSAGALCSSPGDRTDSVDCLDYGRSFICNPKPFNAVRFWIESRTTLFDDRSGRSLQFYQCASCKSEHTFAEKNLFHEDNYDFLPIFGEEDLLIFRRHARITPSYRRLYKAEDVWGKPILKLRKPEPVRALETWDEIRDATASGTPLVTQTEITDPKTGLRAVVECPTKTMNISLEKRMYQVDTGPVALPDLTKRHDSPIDSLRLAFIAFNAPNFADFVVDGPTPVTEDGKELCKVYHYSNPISFEAKNRVLAVG